MTNITTISRVPAEVSDASALVHVFERMARDPAIPVDRVRELWALQREIMTDQARVAFEAAFAEMQCELPEIPERGRIDIGRGKPQGYALWEDINAIIKPVLSKHGFGLRFLVKTTDKIEVTAILGHRCGHSVETTMTLPLDQSGSKNVVQSYGSATSYGKRYTAAALLNLTSRGEDDDGRAAGGKNGNGHLSDEQLEAIQSLIVQTNSNIKLFCNFFKIENVSELPAKRFAEAQSMLKRKLAPQEAGE